MRIAKFAKTARNKSRILYYATSVGLETVQGKTVKKRDTDLLLPILPFEKSFEARGVHSTFVGHPLLDELHSNKPKSIQTEKPLIALLPGSRKQEIKKMLPVMMQVADGFSDYQFVIAGAPSIPRSFYRSITGDSYLPISSNKTYRSIGRSKISSHHLRNCYT